MDEEEGEIIDTPPKQLMFKLKYLKYKNKYLQLKKALGK